MMDVEPTPAALPRRNHRRRWLIAGTAVVVALAVGGWYAVSTGVGREKHRYTVTVIMVPEVTTRQSEAVMRAARDLDPVYGPSAAGSDIESDVEAEPDPERRRELGEMMGGGITFITESPSLDCDPVTELRDMPGVQHVFVEGLVVRDGQRSRATCP